MNILLLGFTLLGGVMLSAQSSINGAFSQKAGALESTFLTFFTGMLILALAILFFGQGNVLLLLEAPRWQLSAVLFGVSYLFLTILAVPQIGVTAASIATVIGQLGAGMVIDHIGAFGGVVVPLDGKRLLGLLAMLVALYFVYRGNTRKDVSASSDSMAS
ncbi:DMT family transporter [Exiguobacterium acetylicum]|uniref:DMT family transporter n=1 Tax=Exiguobacterium acetylicum TaxID=41170 RepID=UPI000682608E|nr:DMT family transporter [Exiguobacterium acetylicum]KNH32377.1 membrane protein [Exiguobacterium acetylicum]